MNPLNLTNIDITSHDFHTMRLFYTSMEQVHTLLVLLIALVVPLMMVLILVLVYKLHAMRRRVIPSVRLEEEFSDYDLFGAWAKEHLILDV
ncbi:unnamed protein product [Bursaphelenchus xylophilus]|uniref:(pine wood nematode) hypothetical protein n=1 Tax=Bursaphelenchus xylophilus TaxID=6326 RepID=A0A1I7SQ37_BURXY|nr:unnamed protein product [Bursaphelenchus xylophilus]CAG9109566.1 unnamed protein product [Bursaphelenchus xylophilus]